MKALLALFIVSISFNSQAQVFDGNFTGFAQAMSSYQDAYEKSEEVLSFIELNENMYDVRCGDDGKAYSVYPYVRIGYKVKCFGTNNQVVRLKIISKYEKNENGEIKFKVIKKVAVEKTNR